MLQNKFRILFFLFFLCCSSAFAQDKEPMMELNSASLTERWLLDQDKVKSFKIMPHKPVYMLLYNYTGDINNQPKSENPINTVNEPTEYQNAELTFQLSFKSRIGRLNKNKKFQVDFWLAYTQLSKWQVYNGALSRPFRETNYEPELIVVFPVNYKIFGLDGVYFGVALTHQSNGQSDPYSRSWNRVIFHAGWENENWSIVFNPWIRWDEEAMTDNNPEIENYMGRAQLLTAFSKGKTNLSLAARHSLRGGNNNRGSLRLQANYQIAGNLYGLLQVFHGYGENMIDYNHKQTTVGIGVSLVRWR